MNLHQNVQITSKKQNTLFIKVSMALLLSMTLLAGVLGFHAPQTHAATNDAYVTSAINDAFGSYSGQALRIAQCESTMNPGATNSMAIGNSHAEGLFQILYPSTWSGTSQAGASPYDARANARAAFEIFKRDGYSWREWQCQP
ncbi:hypothetical protein [Dictyobacter arantiisoli]|uniref:Transglycosylase SLT domain-containing protein n=1 Tax=Dictyobacter arantiisoli TaxID=2014874 RepID=A0A5A5T9D5_9CHLR|nr:hypothetical protein [Dictyobacter arantiisoli]GCF07524.1 hypothetical protein KDI_10880 [Dictyobacter arantiisoli]